MREQLLEVIVQHPRLVGEASQRRVVAHRADGVAQLANDRRIAENTARIPHPYALVDAEKFIDSVNRADGEICFLITREKAVLGAVGLATAEHIVRQRYRDHIVSVVDAGTVLKAGLALGGAQRDKGSRPRPDYLIEAWKPGEPSKVTFVVCRGNHQKPSKRSGRTRSTIRSEWVRRKLATRAL